MRNIVFRSIITLAFTSLCAHAAEVNQLSPEEKAAGWKLLFNGKDLTGWRIFGKQTPPGPGWEVQEGGVLHKGPKAAGGNIVTTDTFTDYELVWEWKISEKGNNGIKYLIDEKRGGAPGPEYQMLDDNGHPDAKNGKTHQTAALYDLIAASDDKPAKLAGEWNESKIIIKGNHVEHWLNGKKVVSYELGSPEIKELVGKSKFKTAAGFGEKITGPIMLTDHVDEVFYRNIKIHTL